MPKKASFLKYKDIIMALCAIITIGVICVTGTLRGKTTISNWEGIACGKTQHGSTGPCVRLIQQALDSLRVSPRSDIDGKFDSTTQRAVKDFQQQQGLTADGIVGPFTKEALAEDLAYAKSQDGHISGMGSWISPVGWSAVLICAILALRGLISQAMFLCSRQPGQPTMKLYWTKHGPHIEMGEPSACDWDKEARALVNEDKRNTVES